MEGMAEMIARVAQPGRVVWIGVRPARLAPVQSVSQAVVGVAGLEGDHARPGLRAVTLFQAEHLAAVGSFLGSGPLDPVLLRRNLLVDRINLSALKDRPLAMGGAVLRITGPCAPCSRIEAALGPGGYAALRGHGGWCAEVVSAGGLSVGDGVWPQDLTAPS
jgi:MOSC domain-containing protein YiiM